MMSQIIKRNFLLLALITLAQVASANNMLLDRMIVYFEPDKPLRQDIRVSNISSENLYLQTEIYEVIEPGAKNEELVRVTNPDKMKLLTTPQKSVITPNGQRSVRLVSLETPKEQEKVYRITFRPVTANADTETTGIQLLIAYQALVFVRPKNPYYKITAKKEGKKITFTNEGNSNVFLRNGRQCPVGKKPLTCTDINDEGRLYAGKSLTIDLPEKKGEVSFGIYNGKEEKRQIFSL